MTLKKRLAGRAAMLACAAAVAGAGVSTSARAEAPQALSTDDARAYSAAFEATERGDFIDAQMQTAGVKDPSLFGYLSFRELMHPTQDTEDRSCHQLSAMLRAHPAETAP